MSPRLDGLDRLRGSALVLMLVHHLTGWFGSDARALMPGWSGFAVTDVAAVAFTVALGASVPLLIDSRRRRGVHGRALAATVLRRYGLLIPIGLALRAAVGFELDHAGVLETLGLCALLTAVVASTVSSSSARATIAAAVLIAAPGVEQLAADRSDPVSTFFLSGTFPLVAYLGLALVGCAAVPHLRSGPRRRPAALLAASGVIATVVLIAGGNLPDRYPGDSSFLVPGLAGTALLYLLVSSPRLDRASLAGRTIERAGAHTFGVFVGHYAIYAALREAGLLHDAPAPVALTLAVAVTLAIVWVAPRVPQPPWSPRTGWRNPRPVEAPPIEEDERVPALR